MVNSLHPPDGADFYVAASLSVRDRCPDLEQVAAWTGAHPWTTRPLPHDRPGLVLTARGPQLRVPGLPPLWWHPNLTGRRLADGARDPLVLALDLRPGEAVLDGTLGFGYDALVVAAAGGRVLGLEVVGPVAFFTLDGLHRHARDLARRVRVARADHRAWLEAAPPGAVDHVYLDPPFPPDRPGATPTFAPLRALAPARRPDAGLVAAALRVARRSVVIRLAPGETPPVVPDAPPARVSASRRLRHAVWRHEPAPSDG